MAHQPNPAGKFLGLYVQGDIGPITYYTSARAKIVAFVKSPPLCPPTVTQQHMRNLFRLAARSWRSLDASTRALWQRIAEGAGLRAEGFGLYVWFQRTRDRPQLATYARLAGEPLP